MKVDTAAISKPFSQVRILHSGARRMERLASSQVPQHDFSVFELLVAVRAPSDLRVQETPIGGLRGRFHLLTRSRLLTHPLAERARPAGRC
jgi:hypothetical protein